MLEHSAMYLNVTPPYEDDTSFFPDFYTTRLGPCELQDSVWAKMSTVPTGVNKKRKKSDIKNQSQINKCNNEKRRREQENNYIEELAELISANIADMSTSVKPDKCAILQEAVNQIRSIKQETTTQSSDPVQQGEVSSSRPTILSNELYGPLLLEALEGFLFVVNSEGKVEHVTENVSTYIKYTKEDILGKSIYNFIHHGDHTKFHSNLLPMTIEWGNEQQVTNRSKSIDIRLLVKPPDDIDETVEEKQQRNFCYELMHISSTQLRDTISVSEEDGSDNGPCLLCVASRISHRDKAICSIEQFTTKLDTTGKIICVDTSSVSDLNAVFIKKELKNRVLKELVPPQDVHKVNAHLRETLNTGQSTSAIYRLQIAQDRYVHVQTKSKLFKTHATNDSDFIMATHSIIDAENDSLRPSDPGGGSLSTTPTNNNNNSNSSSVGGPLMTSVVNGTVRNGTALTSNNDTTTTSSTSNVLFNPNSGFNAFNLDNEYLDIFPSSTWELDTSNWQETTRPDSRHSVNTPTSRPPSNPSYSNAPTVVQSSPFQTQPSPSVPNPATPVAYGGANFPFSPLEEQNYPMEEQKDTKANVIEDGGMMEPSNNKLRNLLTEPQSDIHKDRILKELLNRKDDDTGKNDNRQSPRGLMNRPSMPGPSELPKSSSGPNNMLLQLLNDKSSDDDDLESRAGVKNKSELLQQLLKSEKDGEDGSKSDSQAHREDSLLRSLGFPPSPSNERPRKRPSEDRDEGPSSKREAQVSSSGNSLRERNKMLASLLAKQPVNNQPIPPVPAHEITATPQEKLPRITDPNKNIQLAMAAQSNSMSNSMTNAMSTMMNNAMGNARMSLNRMPGRPVQATNYLNAVLTASTVQQRNDVRQQLNQANSNCFPATSSTTPNTTIENNNLGLWDNNNITNQMPMSNDPMLSELLDQVIDIVPDDIMQLLEPTGVELRPTQGNNFQQRLTETMAIEFIQKSLMQYESVVKSTSSLTMLGTPPAYSTANLTNQMGVFSHPTQAAAKLQQRTQQMRLGVATQQYAGGALTPNQQQLLLQQKKIQQQKQQQEQKRRLLMQQKQQQLLIPSNAAVNEINSMQNIDSLLNNTVAPNVTLKRSSSVPEPQLSPGYGGQLTTQAQRVGTSQQQQQQPYSPHSQITSPLGQQNFTQTTTVGSFPNAGQRLSPQSQFNAQLSPRQAYPQANAQNAAWQQQTQVRLTMQQNPMLTAQLTGNNNNFGPNGRNFQRPSPQTPGQPQPQQQRSLNSPGSVVQTRHSPYPADQFPPPTSPNSAFNNQYLRIQRTNSAPTATTQLPGGLGSPRPYGREHHHSHPPPSPYHPSLPPPPPHPQQQPPPPNLPPPPQAQSQQMMYQQHQDSQYCPSYDPMGYPGVDRGRPVPPPHLQPGVSTSGPTSEFVRQELRAVVGARTAQAQPQTPQPTQASARGQQSQMLGVGAQQQSPVTDLESYGITFEMQPGASDSPKLWGTMGSDMGSISPQPPSSRTSMEETRQGDQKSSLLQKLLSE